MYLLVHWLGKATFLLWLAFAAYFIVNL